MKIAPKLSLYAMHTDYLYGQACTSKDDPYYLFSFFLKCDDALKMAKEDVKNT